MWCVTLQYEHQCSCKLCSRNFEVLWIRPSDMCITVLYNSLNSLTIICRWCWYRITFNRCRIIRTWLIYFQAHWTTLSRNFHLTWFWTIIIYSNALPSVQHAVPLVVYAAATIRISWVFSCSITFNKILPPVCKCDNTTNMNNKYYNITHSLASYCLACQQTTWHHSNSEVKP